MSLEVEVVDFEPNAQQVSSGNISFTSHLMLKFVSFRDPQRLIKSKEGILTMDRIQEFWD